MNLSTGGMDCFNEFGILHEVFAILPGGEAVNYEILSLFANIGHLEKSAFPIGTIIDKNITNRNIINETPRYMGNRNITDSIVVNAK